MINEEKKYELIKFKDGDFCLDVNVSLEEDTVWLTKEQIALLFNRDRSVISRHINNIYSEGELDKSTSVHFLHISNDNPNNRPPELYNLDVIISVGNRIKSKRNAIFNKWAREIFLNFKSTYKNNVYSKPLVVFEYGNVSLDVNIDPDKDTVWLSKEQIAVLYDTTRQNVEYHINNIYVQNELEECATCKDILQVQMEGNREITRTINIYNLDMIISLGYRINSKNGIVFRKWATRVLKEYLLKGHVINEERCLACNSNIVSLRSKYENIISTIEEMKDIIYQDKSKIFFEGEILEPYTFLRKLFFLAKIEIIIVDQYADKFLLSMLTDIKVNIIIITSSNSYLNKESISNNITIIHNDTIHDRFIIIDNIVYAIGTSINEIGKKRFIIMKLEYITKEMLLKNIM